MGSCYLGSSCFYRNLAKIKTHSPSINDTICLRSNLWNHTHSRNSLKHKHEKMTHLPIQAHKKRQQKQEYYFNLPQNLLKALLYSSGKGKYSDDPHAYAQALKISCCCFFFLLLHNQIFKFTINNPKMCLFSPRHKDKIEKKTI